MIVMKTENNMNDEAHLKVKDETYMEIEMETKTEIKIEDLIQLSQQLSLLASSCNDYDIMREEVLRLLEAYESDEDDAAKSMVNEIAMPMLNLLNRFEEEKKQDEYRRQQQLIKTAINTLSFTELEMVLRIFDALEGGEGVLIAGKIADGLVVTRSIVVSALRKLEGAGIIETRSLGVKGTYIKVLNPLLLGELGKFRI